jgi:acetyl-CoA carboxylase carboxyltransferase component
MQGTVISLSASVSDTVRAGSEVAILEAMKMEHVIVAPVDGTIRQWASAPGDTLFEGHPILFVEPGEVDGDAETVHAEIDPDHIRGDLAEVLERHDVGLDHRRPAAVERRRRTGHRTARENVADLVDEGSWVEYGHLALADQRDRFDKDWLIENSPADGMLAGLGTINAELFGADDSQAVVMAYDYTVFAGTQGQKNHVKKDRMMSLAEQARLPVVFYAEGGGGRPGADWEGSPGFDIWTFHAWGRLSGLVPLVGITTGRCFAGNAAILGCCDVIIATEGSNIGMGGPAMIEGGGLGVYTPEEVGPLEVQVPNGVVDIVVADEEEATAVAKKYLGYFQGRTEGWEAHDQRPLRHVVPENRHRVFDVREVVERIADVDSVLELRPEYGLGMVTSLARIEGRPVGIIANNGAHLGGAIDGDASDKASRFMQICDAFAIPVVMLCDTPGIMVGPEVEKYERKVAELYDIGKALNVATHFEVDDVIDPADARFWIARGLQAAANFDPPSQERRRPSIDTW